MTTATATPNLDSLSAWTLARLLANLDPAGVNLTTLPAPWGAVALVVEGAAPADRVDALTGAVLPLGLDPNAIALELAFIDVNAAPPQPAKPRYVLRWAREALGACPPMEWLVDEIFPAVGTALVFGEPGSKKTWSALHLAVSVAMGADWLGRMVRQGPVLIVDEESGDSRMRRRLSAVMRALSAPDTLPLAYTCLAGFKPGDPADLVELDTLVGNIRPVLVLVDALADVLAGDENSVKDVMPLMQGLRQIAESHSCLVAIIHHANRTAGTYRGSSAIVGAVDLVLKVDSKPDSPNVDLEITKTRDAEPCSFSALATWDPIDDSFSLLATAKVQTVHYSRSEQYVIDYLIAHGASPLADIVNRADVCSPPAAKKAVYSLASKKAIRRCDGGGEREPATYELAAGQKKASDPYAN